MKKQYRQQACRKTKWAWGLALLLCMLLLAGCGGNEIKDNQNDTGDKDAPIEEEDNNEMKDSQENENIETPEKENAELRAPYYIVSTDGSDMFNGTEEKPFKTISRALKAVKPGDTIYVKEGTYKETVLITQQGEPDAWITLTAYPGDHPVVSSTVQGAVWLKGASYIEVSGLTAESSNTYGAGIRIQKSDNGELISHHLRIYNNVVRNSGESGISSAYADYVHVKGNVSYGNSRLSEYQGSGITLWESVKYDDEPGFHNIVENNICYDNMNGVDAPWCKGHTDGNGIIIDYPGHDVAEDAPSTLVQNNICFDNGGRGISLTHAFHTTVINNTCYMNSKDPDQFYHNVEFEIAEGSDNIVRNNIFYGIGGENLIVYYKAANVITENNCYYNGNQNITGDNPVLEDPQFTDPALDFDTADFSLKEGSPCINAGTGEGAPQADFAGTDRPQGDQYDIGAYEYTK